MALPSRRDSSTGAALSAATLALTHWHRPYTSAVATLRLAPRWHLHRGDIRAAAAALAPLCPEQ